MYNRKTELYVASYYTLKYSVCPYFNVTPKTTVYPYVLFYLN